MKSILGFIFLLIGTSVQSFEIEVVGPDVCSSSGAYYWRCEPLAVTLSLSSVEQYVPQEVTIQVNKNNYCSSAYPIYVVGQSGNAELFRNNIFQTSSIVFPQNDLSEITIAVGSPYRNSVYYYKSCSITLNVGIDQVNIPELTQNLSDLKLEAESELALVTDLLETKTQLLEISGVVELIYSVVELAEADLNDFYELDNILQSFCSENSIVGDDCSWTAQATQIGFSAFLNLTISQITLLRTLGIQLDILVPSDCETGACIADLIDDSTEQVIISVSDSIPSESDLLADIEEYVAQELTLNAQLAEYEGVANRYGINWEAL